MLVGKCADERWSTKSLADQKIFCEKNGLGQFVQVKRFQLKIHLSNSKTKHLIIFDSASKILDLSQVPKITSAFFVILGGSDRKVGSAINPFEHLLVDD